MAPNRIIRLSQTVNPFGVGGIYDFLGESLIACDTSYWKHHGHPLRSPRLAVELGVKTFRTAPTQSTGYGSGTGPGVPYFRFPQWLFCQRQRCRTMVRWSSRMETPGEPARCHACTKQLVPMRWVVVCEVGHVFDLPWNRWAHSHGKAQDEKQCRSHDLEFLAKAGAGGGLDTLSVRCRTCGARRSLSGITGKESLRPLGIHCQGRQPWQPPSAEQPCEAPIHVVQRSASNIYFATNRSALDIPPYSDYSPYSELTLRITSEPDFAVVMSGPEGILADMLITRLAGIVGCTEDAVRAVVKSELAARAGEGDRGRGAGSEVVDLVTGEWNAFLHEEKERDDRSTFVTEHVGLTTDDVPATEPVARVVELVDKVVLARRLREVRALVGFTRFNGKDAVPPDLGRGLDWLPAIEVFGEGVFISLAEKRVREWETRTAAVRRAAVLEARRQESYIGVRRPVITPRLVLIHTLAHLLVRRLSHECGYSTASLRERLYCRTPEEGEAMCGVLIYTAAGDVEGTMGGLARQGEAPRFLQTVLGALEAASWCSVDPLCAESSGQGFGALNLAACHACSLLPETSCELGNSSLDRVMLLGGGGEGVEGFFTGVLEAAVAESARRAVR